MHSFPHQIRKAEIAIFNHRIAEIAIFNEISEFLRDS